MINGWWCLEGRYLELSGFSGEKNAAGSEHVFLLRLADFGKSQSKTKLLHMKVYKAHLDLLVWCLEKIQNIFSKMVVKDGDESHGRIRNTLPSKKINPSIKYPLVNQHSYRISPFSTGSASSMGPFFIAILLYRSVSLVLLMIKQVSTCMSCGCVRFKARNFYRGLGDRIATDWSRWSLRTHPVWLLHTMAATGIFWSIYPTYLWSSCFFQNQRGSG